jgi:DNA-directed RNA polymerase subunit M/transcription elongation factor TFIIS
MSTEQSLIETIKLICSNPDNQKLVLKYAEKFHNPVDIVYELGFLIKSEGMSLKESISLLKEKKLGHNHPRFNEILKKIIETDNFMDDSFEVTEGSESCQKCKSQRTLSYSKHLNDEGACVFIFCVDCKHRFIIRS